MSFDLSYRIPAFLRKKVRKGIIKLSEPNIKYKMVELNEIPKIDGPAIYVGNHTTSSDSLILQKIIKKQCYVIAGKQRFDFKSKFYFFMIGNIKIEREKENFEEAYKNFEEDRIEELSEKENSKKKEKQAYNKIIKCIKNGISIMIFPEVTWCVLGSKYARKDLNEANPINHMKWGSVKIAKDTGVPIIVSTMEYIGDTCYILHSDPIYISKDMSDIEAIHLVEGTVLESKYKIQKQFSKIDNYNMSELEHRKLVATLEEKNNAFVQKSYDEYPSLEPEKEKGYIFNAQRQSVKKVEPFKFDSPEKVFGPFPDAKERLKQLKKELSLEQQRELEAQESDENKIKM